MTITYFLNIIVSGPYQYSAFTSKRQKHSNY